MTAESLLRDIREFIDVAINSRMDESERPTTKFTNGASIIEAIDEWLEQSGEGFDPYTDPDTVAMLERAGIATYMHR